LTTVQLFNLIAREDTQASLQIAEAAKSDSGAMKTIAIMTMLFLPATFFAALFSMPLLKWDSSLVIQKKFWVYLAFAVPCTVIIVLFWLLLTYRRTIRRWKRRAGRIDIGG
jgi:Mg2+ and Co2+ transporter CorA